MHPSSAKKITDKVNTVKEFGPFVFEAARDKTIVSENDWLWINDFSMRWGVKTSNKSFRRMCVYFFPVPL